MDGEGESFLLEDRQYNNRSIVSVILAGVWGGSEESLMIVNRSDK